MNHFYYQQKAACTVTLFSASLLLSSCDACLYFNALHFPIRERNECIKNSMSSDDNARSVKRDGFSSLKQRREHLFEHQSFCLITIIWRRREFNFEWNWRRFFRVVETNFSLNSRWCKPSSEQWIFGMKLDSNIPKCDVCDATLVSIISQSPNDLTTLQSNKTKS